MKARKIFLYVDVIVQAVLIAAILVSVIIYNLGIGAYRDVPSYGIIATIFIGVWQVLSGLILVITTNDKWRIKYLISVVIWFIVVAGILFSNIEGTIPKYVIEPIAYILYLTPFAFAIAYFRHTYLHLLKITSLPVSFWKL